MFKSKIKRIHFIGIGGIGMSGMAELLASEGYLVSGSDLNKNDRTESLKKIGLKIYIGHRSSNISGANLIVYSSAVKKDNIEIKAAEKLKIPVIKRAEMLAELVRIKPTSIGVSGTHGKTTTCSLIGSIFYNADLDPTIAIGGIVKSFGTNAISGSGDVIIVEADEYDKTFLSLKPVIGIINNIEAEHLDCYKDFQDLKDSFSIFANNIPFYGFIVVNLDDSNISDIIGDIKRPVIGYSIDRESGYNAKNIQFDTHKTQFDLYHSRDKIDTITLSIPGYHNVYNALASIALCMELGISIELIKKSLSAFKGVKRRFDIKYNDENNIYIDDYAHHPTEVKSTINAIRNGWPGKKVLSVFQPHLYSRTKFFYKEFASALLDSDKIILLDIYGAREEKIDGVTSKIIKDEIIKSGNPNCVVVDHEKLIEELKNMHNQGDLIVTMGAGDLWSRGVEIIEYLSI